MSDTAILQAAQAINLNLSAIQQALVNALIGNASTGKFTMPAGASKTVTDAHVTATSIIMPIALNASAATLMGSAKALYPTASAGSVTFATANGAAAAGSEQFAYLTLNLA